MICWSMRFDLWYRAGSCNLCLLTAMLYVTTAVRLLRRSYEGIFQYGVHQHMIYGSGSCEAWLSHITGAGSCELYLLTSMLYETTAVRLLRRNHANSVRYDNHQHVIHGTGVGKAWLSHNTGAGSCAAGVLSMHIIFARVCAGCMARCSAYTLLGHSSYHITTILQRSGSATTCASPAAGRY
jgi:hypothetical protein